MAMLINQRVYFDGGKINQQTSLTSGGTKVHHLHRCWEDPNVVRSLVENGFPESMGYKNPQ